MAAVKGGKIKLIPYCYVELRRTFQIVSYVVVVVVVVVCFVQGGVVLSIVV